MVPNVASLAVWEIDGEQMARTCKDMPNLSS